MSSFPVATDESIAKDDFNILIGTLKSQPYTNLLANGNFERTTHADLQCDYWQETGAVNVRSDTQKKWGKYSLKISPTATTDYAYQDIINWADFLGIASIGIGCWVYAPNTDVVLRIRR
ncbi:unnamed protein product, partial [marine sediment metagenome]